MALTSKKRKAEQLSGDFREIFVTAKRELVPYGTVFILHPENIECENLGILFGVIKIDDTSNDSSYISNLLVSVLKKEYFSNPSRPADASFEASLRKANLALAELARQGSVKWSGHINFAGGILEKNNLHFSKLGNAAILLIRGGQIADIGHGMGLDPTGTNNHPLKTFSDISSGKLEKNDLLIVATGDLLEIFSTEEIRQHANRFSKDEFFEFLSVSLTDNSELASAIVLNFTSKEELAKKKIEKFPERLMPVPERAAVAKRQVAEENRVLLQEIAEKPPTPKKKSSIDLSRTNDLFTSEQEEMPKRKRFVGSVLSSSRNILAGVGNGTSNILKKTKGAAMKTDWRKKMSSAYRVSTSVSRSFGRFGWMREKINLRLMVILGAVILIAGFSVAFLKKRSASPPPLETAPQSTAPVPTTLEDKQVKTIETLTEVAKLSSTSRDIITMDGIPYLISGDKSLMSVDPANSEPSTYTSDLSLGKFSSMAAMPDLNTIFIITADKKIVAFTPSNKKFQENSISLPGNLNATDVKTFLTYLYILDSSANQIYRFPRAEGGFGDKQDWLKSGGDISSAKSFAINEDLFIASQDQISAFYQGKKDEKINIENTDVPLAIDKIYTEANFSNIYVLDNKNHRVVSFSTDGKIVSQFWDNSISGVKDFSVDEKNNIVYLLLPDSVSKFSMD